jgi:mRNA interferase MazF
MTASMRRGDVVLVRLDPTGGSEIRKTRLAVVVSNNVACKFDAGIQVVPLTTLPSRKLRPYESRVDAGACGLDKDSRAVANQIRTIATHRIVKTFGRLTPTEVEALDRALMVQLGLSQGR